LKVVAEGASFIGGCCGSNPAFIAAVRAALDAR
jgi:S-methylmethionine-dependent homocysteine/selenocysteine methylase